MLNKDELLLDDIIQKGWFQHVFQPIYNLNTWEKIGYEALLTCEFFQNYELLIKSAINCNRIYDMDTTSIYKALISINLAHEKLFVSVHISTIMNQSFFIFLEELKRSHYVNENIVFNINEIEKVTDYSTLNKIVGTVKKKGFIVAFDDFGKGEISLEFVNEVKPNFLKMDRSFADGLFRSREKQDKIQMLLEICKKHDINLILEGIEDSKDLAIAKVLGVQLAKGCLLGEPMSINEFYVKGENTIQ